MCIIGSLTYKLLMMSGLSCAILIRVFSEIKYSRKDTYNRQYQTFSQKSDKSLDDCFARFKSIISNLRPCGPLAYSDNERVKQLIYALDNHV
jgi:hypothetical protein